MCFPDNQLHVIQDPGTALGLRDGIRCFQHDANASDYYPLHWRPSRLGQSGESIARREYHDPSMFSPTSRELEGTGAVTGRAGGGMRVVGHGEVVRVCGRR